jgi:hypothetical protein
MVIGVGALGKLQLAQYDRAGFVQAAHRACVFIGSEISMDSGAGCGRETLCPEQVLQRNRNTMQRPTILACRDFGLRGCGLRHCGIGHHMDVAAEVAVQRGDAVELRAGNLLRRNLAHLDKCRELRELEIMQIVDHGIHFPSPSSIGHL